MGSYRPLPLFTYCVTINLFSIYFAIKKINSMQVLYNLQSII